VNESPFPLTLWTHGPEEEGTWAQALCEQFAGKLEVDFCWKSWSRFFKLTFVDWVTIKNWLASQKIYILYGVRLISCSKCFWIKSRTGDDKITTETTWRFSFLLRHQTCVIINFSVPFFSFYCVFYCQKLIVRVSIFPARFIWLLIYVICIYQVVETCK